LNTSGKDTKGKITSFQCTKKRIAMADYPRRAGSYSRTLRWGIYCSGGDFHRGINLGNALWIPAGLSKQ
jgi:hypothetical protein